MATTKPNARSTRPATGAEGEVHSAHTQPTKELVVEVLTKDIGLVAAILDLVDNSIDAARRLAGTAGSLEGYGVTLTFVKDGFQLQDNCGGIGLADAEERAFRFGPDPRDPPDAFSTGQFGVGMKRALFKLGRAFEVRSRAARDGFDLKVAVSDWLIHPDWDFPLTNVETGINRPEQERGTTIVVRPLKPAIRDQLKRTTVQNDLKTQLAQRHQRSIARGFEIKVGRTPLTPDEPEVVCDDDIVPLVDIDKLNGKGDPIDVTIVCGVSPGTQREAGWYVFLNERAVLLADQSELTGWGEKEDAAIPRFHPQYGRFRGFAFLTCEDTTRLPWDTTKTGLDTGDDVYRRVRTMMVDAADSVVDFLDDLSKEEKQEGARYGDVAASLQKGTTVSVFQLETAGERKWKAPSVTTVRPDRSTTRVYTDREITLVDRAKRKARVTTNKELGDYLFDYFVRRELR